VPQGLPVTQIGDAELQKVLIFSILLIAGLAGSQFMPLLGETQQTASTLIRLLTMFLLAFIMIHVGYEFEIDRSRLQTYGFDYLVAATAAAFPWIFCAVYFVYALYPAGSLGDLDVWKESLLASRFAAPTSAGVLFSMLAAAGLSATWYFRKIRILAIFDDLDTVLLMIPLKMLIVGVRWQLVVVVCVMAILLWFAWTYLHRFRIPVTWRWVLTYAAGITVVSEVIYIASKLIDDVVPIHIEVLLPAFVLGAMMARPTGHDPHTDDARDGHQEGPENPGEQRVSTIISGVFMVLVGLSMPVLGGQPSLMGDGGYSTIIWHVLIVTILANLGKMFPLFCYRREAHWRERLAIGIGMWPRGEVGAGVLVISLGYGISGGIVAVAALSLALNLFLTGLFIVIVKALLNRPGAVVKAA
jgi:Kef-type K+ transport system membrane component KefB